MGRKKLIAKAGDRDADIFAASRCVELLRVRAREEHGLTELRIEVDPAPWDDLEEVRTESDGRTVRSRYQIKRIETSLEREALGEMMLRLEGHSDEGRLVLPRPVDVQGLGETRHLASLCDRARNAERADELLGCSLANAERGFSAPNPSAGVRANNRSAI